jgi:hypothetical protein
MYANLAQAVHACETSDQFAASLKQIRKKLEERVPPLEEFKFGFSEIIYLSDFTRDRNLVRYILRRISEHYGLPAEIDASLYTVEHLRSESEAHSNEESQVVGALGNLLFVPEELNQKLRNRPFLEKLSILKKAKVPMDPFLKAQKRDWGVAQIHSRTTKLAELGYTKLWRMG